MLELTFIFKMAISRPARDQEERVSSSNRPAEEAERWDARRFFALPDATKAEIAMGRGGSAWRGWFPVGGELTSGRPDLKEGLYFGEELAPTDPRVAEGRPLHGPNLFPAHVPEMRPLVLDWMDAMAGVARAVLRGVAGALGVGETWFEDHLTGSPTTLFRIFHYPPSPADGVDAERASDGAFLRRRPLNDLPSKRRPSACSPSSRRHCAGAGVASMIRVMRSGKPSMRSAGLARNGL